VTQIISVTIMNLVTPKAGAKHELLFNKPPQSALLKLEITQNKVLLNLPQDDQTEQGIVQNVLN
jgi:hypothetical protein